MKRCGTTHQQSKHQPTHWATETRAAPAGGQFSSQLPGPGPEGRRTPLCCSRNSGPDTLVLGLLLCLLSCARPPDICHLFSAKFSCKVSQCVVPDDQHVTLPGCSQIAFSSFIHVGFPRKALAAREGSMPFPESRCEREHWMRREDYRHSLPLIMTTDGVPTVSGNTLPSLEGPDNVSSLA